MLNKILFTGGVGAGKTLSASCETQTLIRKQRIKVAFINWKIRTIKNPIIKLKNKLRTKKYNKLIKKGKLEEAKKYTEKKPLLNLLKEKKRPLVYSNMPMHFRPHMFSPKREWSTELEVDHILLFKEINEYSIVVMDEFPQFISQFDWNEELVQKNCNEFITFFRHYIGGYLIITAQSEEEIECHFRRKLNQGIWCFNCKIWPLPFIPLFYTVRMCDFMLSDNITTMSTTYIEENTRIHFGIMPHGLYDTRCYSPRYDKVSQKMKTTKKWKNLKTKKVMRFRPYISPLDTQTTEEEINRMKEKAKKLKRNDDE